MSIRYEFMLRKILQWMGHALIAVILTGLSQVGGIVYLLYLPFGSRLRAAVNGRWTRGPLWLLGLLLIWLLVSLVVVPSVAPLFGRRTLPLVPTADMPFAPASWGHVLLNRHYVKPKLYEALRRAGQNVNKRYPDLTIIYLDANFPFLDGFPMLPHRSHDDGEKVDFSFVYRRGGQLANVAATLTGYGVFVEPAKGERRQTQICKRKGYWQYDFTKYVTGFKRKVTIDEKASRDLVAALIRQKAVRKVFIEPHLKARWGFGGSGKVRFTGCAAVRHDDHIHVEL